MTRHSYREHDYTFGQAMLPPRGGGVGGRPQLSQSPHLQHVLELCVQQHIFAPEREEEEIRALWKTAHRRVLLDEGWLSALLARPSAPPAPVEEAGGAAAVRASPALVQLSSQVQTPVAHMGVEPAASRRVDWGGALDVSHFSGRDVEVAELSEWIVQEHCLCWLLRSSV